MKLPQKYNNKVNRLICSLDWNKEYSPEQVGQFGTQRDWNKTILTKIQQCSHNIHKFSLAEGADSIYVSVEALNVIEDLENFHSSWTDEKTAGEDRRD